MASAGAVAAFYNRNCHEQNQNCKENFVGGEVVHALDLLSVELLSVV